MESEAFDLVSLWLLLPMCHFKAFLRKRWLLDEDEDEEFLSIFRKAGGRRPVRRQLQRTGQQEQQHFSELGLVPEAGSWHLFCFQRVLVHLLRRWADACHSTWISAIGKHGNVCSPPASELPAGKVGVFITSLALLRPARVRRPHSGFSKRMEARLTVCESEMAAELQEAGTCSYGTSLTLSKSMPEKSPHNTGFRSCHLTLSAGKGQFAFYSQMSMSYSDLCKPNSGKGSNYGQMREICKSGRRYGWGGVGWRTKKATRPIKIHCLLPSQPHTFVLLPNLAQGTPSNPFVQAKNLGIFNFSTPDCSPIWSETALKLTLASPSPQPMSLLSSISICCLIS